MLASRIAIAIAVVAALAGSQGPEFAQQYRQRAGGALDELKAISARFVAECAEFGLTPLEGVKRLEANSDGLARKRGEDIARTMARAESLEAQLGEMATAGPFMRMFVMAQNVDHDIAVRTLDAFEPAAPMTVEALVTAGAFGLLGYGAVHLVAAPLRRRPRPRTQPAAA